ncbi:MAG TPA: S8 family serine peptidase, partial [Terriglobales bacterium]|nr:S8 family serine peptidase [Terriglobales bacterium]
MKRPKKIQKKKAWSATWGGTKPFLLLAFCLLLLNLPAMAERVSHDLQAKANSPQLVNVIVQYKSHPDNGHVSTAKRHGALLKQQHDLINAITVTMPANRVEELAAADPEIAYISPDRKLSATSFSDGFVAANADVVQNYGYNGSGVGVAVIDSGIGSNADLRYRVVYAKDFTGSFTTDDQYGHGTHVAGIIAGNGSQSSCGSCFRTFMGVAPSVKLLNLKVLDATGSGTDSAVINAIQTAINLKNQYNIRVINLSLGRGVYENYQQDPLDQAVEQAWKAGIFVVVAAGNYGRDNSNNNNGYGTITAPGNDPYVITVGAMRTMGTQTRVDDVIASYSSKGPTMLDHVVKPDIVAAGNLVTSTLGANSLLDTLYPSTQVLYS